MNKKLKKNKIILVLNISSKNTKITIINQLSFKNFRCMTSESKTEYYFTSERF